jgi:hypothetical protein
MYSKIIYNPTPLLNDATNLSLKERKVTCALDLAVLIVVLRTSAGQTLITVEDSEPSSTPTVLSILQESHLPLTYRSYSYSESKDM